MDGDRKTSVNKDFSTKKINKEEIRINEEDIDISSNEESIDSPTIVMEGNNNYTREISSPKNREDEGYIEKLTENKNRKLNFIKKFKNKKLEKQSKENHREQELERLKKLENINWKPVNRIVKKRKKSYLFQKMAIVIVSLVVIICIMLSPLFTIKKISVQGNHYYTKEEIANMCNTSIGNNLWFGAEKKILIKRLLKDPYFFDVKIKRKIPGTLNVIVKERTQAASIKFGGKYIIIDENGRVLRISEPDPKLTVLEGLTLKKINVGEKISAKEKNRLEKAMKILSYTIEGDFYFKKIVVEDDMVTGYIYDTLKVKGTVDQVKNSILSGNLQKVINKLFQNKTKRGTISLGEKNYISFSPTF